ncbi:MAG: hypothetical protein AAGG47_20630 [Pseudomonadota bacterium]
MPKTVGGERGSWVETLFDPQHENVYIITIPSLALFALGIRRGAVLWLFGSIILKVLIEGT